MKFKIKKSYYRLFSVLLSVIMIVLSVPFSAAAQENTEDNTDYIANIGTPFGQDYNTASAQKSPEVLVADAEAMRREQLIQNGIDPDQPLQSNSTAQLVQGGEELEPLVAYENVLEDGVYAFYNIGNTYGGSTMYLDTTLGHWLPGYNMQQYAYPIDNHRAYPRCFVPYVWKIPIYPHTEQPQPHI